MDPRESEVLRDAKEGTIRILPGNPFEAFVRMTRFAV
jgi:hypothetical protein